MIVSHQHKYVFLHIPKTAGTSIQVALRLRTGCTGGIIKDSCIVIGKTKHHIVPEKIPQGYFVFAFVRNPWDRILSYYMFRCKEPRNFARKSIHPNERKASFKEWLNRLDEFKNYKHINPAFHISIQPQIDTIKNYPDFIGKYENIEQDLKFVFNQIGQEYQPLKNVNSTTAKKKHYREYYDTETKEIVARLYEKDIEHFGYIF